MCARLNGQRPGRTEGPASSSNLQPTTGMPTGGFLAARLPERTPWRKSDGASAKAGSRVIGESDDGKSDLLADTIQRSK